MQRVVGSILFVLSATVIGIASECPGNPNALETDRVMVVDPAEHPRVGKQTTIPGNVQYRGRAGFPEIASRARDLYREMRKSFQSMPRLPAVG